MKQLSLADMFAAKRRPAAEAPARRERDEPPASPAPVSETAALVASLAAAIAPLAPAAATTQAASPPPTAIAMLIDDDEDEVVASDAPAAVVASPTPAAAEVIPPTVDAHAATPTAAMATAATTVVVPDKTDAPVPSQNAAPEAPAPAEDTGDCPTTWGIDAAEAVAKENAPSATAMAGLYQDAEGEAFHAFSFAAWTPGAACPFGFWSDVLADVSATSGRNTVMRRLAFGLLTLLMRGTVDEVLHALYICLNEVAPAHEGIELGIGDATLSAVVAEVCGLTPARLKAEYQKTGDLAEVAQTHKKRQATLVTPKPLTLARVFTAFKNIALTSGKDTQRRRGDAIKVLLRDAVGAEVNFLVRSLQGKMRIGVALNTVLTALGHAYALFSLLPEAQRRPSAPPAADGVKPPAVTWNKKRISVAALQLLLNAGASAMTVAFHQCPSVDIILNTVSTTEGGFAAPPTAWLPRLGIRPNLPVKPMLAHPTTGVRQLLDRFAGRAFTCEYKYDGERAQVHYIASPPPAAAAAAAAASASNNKPSFSIFSRNSESYTTKFPDVIAALPAAFAPPADGAPAVTSCILDGEVVAVDPETGRIKPFQVLQHRGKKDVNIQDVSIAVAYFLFDILLLNGRSLLHLSLRERREIMHTVFRETPSVRFARGSDSSDVEDIQAFLEQSVAEGCEGLMVKTLDVDARYTPFKRSHSWLKLKKDYMEGVGDTLDLVVLGAYRGKGKRTGVYGGFLLACFDAASEEFQSICKVGTGFSDADLEQLTNALEAHVIDSMRADYRVDSGLKADVWFDAHLVFEIRAADLSLSPVHSAAIGLVDPNRGIALRFPRYLKLRDDKAATDATSAEQVAAMYRSQAVVAEDGAVGGAGAGDVDDACF